MLEKLGIKSRWDMAPAALSVLLYVNFTVFLILLFTAAFALFLYAAPVYITTGLLIAAIAAHLVTRRRTCRLWRRLLLGGIAADFLIIGFYILMAGLIFVA